MEACNHPFTPLEQEIEDLAIEYDVDEKYDEEAVLRLYGMLERTRLQGSKAGNGSLRLLLLHGRPECSRTEVSRA